MTANLSESALFERARSRAPAPDSDAPIAIASDHPHANRHQRGVSTATVRSPARRNTASKVQKANRASGRGVEPAARGPTPRPLWTIGFPDLRGEAPPNFPHGVPEIPRP